MATIAIRRVRPASTPTRSRNQPARALSGGVTQPQPGELDESFAGPRVPGSPDPPVPVHWSALVQHGRDPDIAAELAAVVNVAGEHLACEHGGEGRANPAQAGESRGLLARRVGGRSGLLRLLRLDLADQLQRQPEPAA